MTDGQEPEAQADSDGISFAEFLESASPSTAVRITDLIVADYGPARTSVSMVLNRPQIQLHCSSESCNGTRFFRCIDRETVKMIGPGTQFVYVNYVCSNCRSSQKTFALKIAREGGEDAGVCLKLGELPVYGPPIPSKLIKLVGPDRELFLKGRRCENHGLGIGAFVYYRRVVESQKNRILDQIIKVASRISAPKATIAELESAKNEVQFSKALSLVKNAIPQSLLIEGHNPLTLLHSALSEGLHDKTDEDCLEIASSIRVVLVELSERLGQALKDEAEVKGALSTLLNVNKKG